MNQPSPAAVIAKEIAAACNGSDNDQCLRNRQLFEMYEDCSIEKEKAFADWLETVITKHLDAHAGDGGAGLQRRLFDECITANWDPERRNSFAEEIAHLHEELSEAFRAWRRYKDFETRTINGKLEGVPIELADTLIGLFYNAELHGFDLLAAVEQKHQFNLTRNYVAEGRQLHAHATPDAVDGEAMIAEAGKVGQLMNAADESGYKRGIDDAVGVMQSAAWLAEIPVKDHPQNLARILQSGVSAIQALATAPDAAPAGHLTAQQEVDAFWTALERSWDIEPRSFFETEAPKNGFESALAMAVHYMWKRETKVEPVRDALVKRVRAAGHSEKFDVWDLADELASLTPTELMGGQDA